MPNSYLDTHQAVEDGVLLNIENERQLNYDNLYSEAHLDNDTWRL